MQLGRIHIHHWGLGIYMHIDCNRFRSRRTQQRNGLIHQIGNIHHLARRRAPLTEGQNPLDQILRAVASTPNLVEAGSDISFPAASNRASPVFPRIAAKILLKSCATPPASVPRASSFETVEVAPLALNVLGPACALVTSRDPNKRTLLACLNSPSVRCFHAPRYDFHRGASARFETKWIRAETKVFPP